MGHLNNAKFFTFLEEARFHWFRTVLGEQGFERHPIILAEARCAFRSAAKPGEVLRVGIRVTRIGRSSFAHEYRIEAGADGRVVAEGESTGVGYDYDKQSSRELGPEFRAAVEAHQGPVA